MLIYYHHVLELLPHKRSTKIQLFSSIYQNLLPLITENLYILVFHVVKDDSLLKINVRH
nr:hypothetical protein [uncultured bacterium]